MQIRVARGRELWGGSRDVIRMTSLGARPEGTGKGYVIRSLRALGTKGPPSWIRLTTLAAILNSLNSNNQSECELSGELADKTTLSPLPLSTQVYMYKWTLANLMLGVILRWTRNPSRGE